MIRDFTDEKLEELETYLKEDSDGLYDDISDLLRSAPDCADSLNLEEYLGWTDTYYKKLFEIYETSHSEIRRVYNEVQIADKTYEFEIEHLLGEAIRYKEYIDKMAEIINPANGIFNTETIIGKFGGLGAELDTQKQEQANKIMEIALSGATISDFMRKFLEKYLNDFIDKLKTGLNWKNISSELKNLMIGIYNLLFPDTGKDANKVFANMAGETPSEKPEEQFNVPAGFRLDKGDKGIQVKGVQTALIELKYSCGEHGVDGHFGNDTEAAVRQFQIDNGLAPTGVVDATTLILLNKMSGGLYNEYLEENKPKEGSAGNDSNAGVNPVSNLPRDTDDVIELGELIYDKADFLKCSDVDVVARCIYGEASSVEGQQAVAWAIMNRCNSNYYDGDITRYDDVVTADGQFSTITGDPNGADRSRNPHTNETDWVYAVELSTMMVNGQGDEIPKPDGITNQKNFRSDSCFNENSRKVNGQFQYRKKDKKTGEYEWYNIYNVKSVGGNTFFSEVK